MKHPILYRIIFYSCLIAPSIGILFLLSLLNYAPFRSSDMRDAYYHGCNLASKPLTDEKSAKCAASADLFKATLDDLDAQLSGQ